MKSFSNCNLAYNQNTSNYQKLHQYGFLQLQYLIKINIKDIKYIAAPETGQVQPPCFRFALSSAAVSLNLHRNSYNLSEYEKMCSLDAWLY